jgi:hypothetical protein
VRLFKRSPVLCEVARCGRLAGFRLSNGPDVGLACARHISTFESRWGQVVVRGISK